MSDAILPVAPAAPPLASAVIAPAAPADGWEQARGGRTLTADVAIVGTGPGGAAAAAQLAAAGLRVVLLEEGPARSTFRRNQAHTSRYHMQEGGSMVAQGNNFTPIAAGRGVGGSTLINGALAFRPPADVLDAWVAALDDPGWGLGALTDTYDHVATVSGVGITPDAVAGENNKIIARGAAALGLEGGLAPRNTPGCVGCGVCYFGCPTNGKASVNLTFLPRAVQDGALIQADTKVVEVLVEGTRAVGLRGIARHPDTGEDVGEVVVRAEHVILSAGAIGTPRLLWHCGLAERLGPVGEGLHVHPGNAVFGLCEQEVKLWTGATQGAYFHHPDLPGVLPHTFSAPPEVCLMATHNLGPRLAQGLAELPHMCGCIVMVSDKSQGRVRATRDGRADIRYSFGEDDLERCKRGLVEAARVLVAGGAHTVFAGVHGVGRHTDVGSFAAALEPRTIQDFTLYAAHPMATCRMGLDPETSVVDRDGRAHGVENLLISDASVFPTSLGVNPQLTTMVVGTTIARRLLDRG